MLSFIKTVNFYLSDYVLVLLLSGTGIFFSFKTRFVQVRCLGQGFKQVFSGLFKKAGENNAITSFQALTASVAAQVGTGNIIGACSAILTGGPGAIFWMWVVAFFSMATAYAEAVLAQKTKLLQPDGNFTGGPVYYIKEAFPGPFGKCLCKFFAWATVIALGFIGTTVQVNAISQSSSEAFGVPGYTVGIAVAILSAFILFGGVKRIMSVTEKLVPFMAMIYIFGGLAVLLLRCKYLPETFAMIFKCAFRPDAVIGGTWGYALKKVLSQGVKKGLFSNEAGMGSTPHAHAVANAERPHLQGVCAMVGVFIDTFCVLTVTGLAVVSALYTGEEAVISGAEVLPESTQTAAMAFSVAFGKKGAEFFIALCLFLFAFSSVIGWNYFAKINFEYLFGEKYTPVFFVVAVVFIFLGSVMSSDFLWECADFFNQLMVIPNALAITALSSYVKKCAIEE